MTPWLARPRRPIRSDLSAIKRARSLARPADLIACLLNEQGLDSLHSLVGNFVVIAGNSLDGQVLAFRDRLGGRTLYCRQAGSDAPLATRAGWIARLFDRAFEPDLVFITGHFCSQPAPPPVLTPFAGVSELMPGQRLVLSGDRLTIDRHKLSLITLGGTGGFFDPGATEPGEPSQPGSFDDEDDYEGNDWG